MSAGERTLIVGDVHGCADELDDLLRHAGFDPHGDRLVFVGDLVAKGPDSVSVVARAREQASGCVLGNHEAHCLRWETARREGAPLPRISPTHEAVCRALSPALFDWLFARPYFLVLPEHDTIVVHGGLAPNVPLEAQDPEHMLNLRTIRADGTLSKKVGDGDPWASHWPGPSRVVFGHDAVRGLQLHPHAIGLDTGCVYGGELTALELPSGRRYAVPARRAWAPT